MMKFRELKIRDAVAVEVEPREDSRGLFARTFCQEEFEKHGLAGRFVQCNTSYNVKRGTLRGMHFQRMPHEEGKLVRCTQGAIWDVALDLRPDSPTFLVWEGVELTAANRMALYLPAGIAHGFQTLTDQAEVFYQMTEFYHSDLADGVRWNDAAFGIRWPIADPILSERDRSYPPFKR